MGGDGDGGGGGGESLSFINTAAVVVTPSRAVNHVSLELWGSTWADPRNWLLSSMWVYIYIYSYVYMAFSKSQATQTFISKALSASSVHAVSALPVTQVCFLLANSSICHRSLVFQLLSSFSCRTCEMRTWVVCVHREFPVHHLHMVMFEIPTWKALSCWSNWVECCQPLRYSVN